MRPARRRATRRQKLSSMTRFAPCRSRLTFLLKPCWSSSRRWRRRRTGCLNWRPPRAKAPRRRSRAVSSAIWASLCLAPAPLPRRLAPPMIPPAIRAAPLPRPGPAYAPPPPPPPQPQVYAPPPAAGPWGAPAGGGFLHNAMSTAAGVAGGVAIGSLLGGLLGGHQASAFGGGLSGSGFPGGGLAGGGGSETINNFYEVAPDGRDARPIRSGPIRPGRQLRRCVLYRRRILFRRFCLMTMAAEADTTTSDRVRAG